MTKDQAEFQLEGLIESEPININLSMLEQDILSVFRAEVLYGLEIKNRINQARAAAGYRLIQFGSLYPTLMRLREAGMIEAADPGTRKDKKSSVTVYRVTEAGRIALNRIVQYREFLIQKTL